MHTRTGSAGASTSEVQDWGHESDVSQAYAYGDDLTDSTTAAPGQASIIEAVAAEQQQADTGSRQGIVKCTRVQLPSLSAWQLAVGLAMHPVLAQLLHTTFCAGVLLAFCSHA